MATRNIVPRANGEGSLGTSAKKWGNIYADNGHIAGRNIATDGATLDSHTTQIEQIRASVGTPLVANSYHDMTDTDKIYVYTGNEQGYTNGNWYYYNGTEWISGGVYNSTAFETDKTLTIEGEAADAKATGDWLRNIAVPVTALPEIPETDFVDEFMKVVVDSEKHVLYGVRRDGSFYWQKGVPAHLIDKIHEIAEPTIENEEYLYVMLDTEGHIILGVKRDGSVDWQKGTPQHVIEACNPTIDNPEYLYLIKDSDDRVVFAIKRDGSVDWQKGTPQHVIEACNPTIKSPEFIQVTQDIEGKLLEGITTAGVKQFFTDVEFKGNINGDKLQNVLFSPKDYAKQAVTSALTTGLTTLYLDGDVSEMTKDNKVNLTYKYGMTEGTCTCKWQGSSSSAYPKKNYSLAKMSIAIDVGWGLHKKYVLKANFIDFSHARNIVSAKLWGEIVKTRNPANARLNILPNGGAIDGFPVMLVINGEYQGLYTMNIPKDAWMFGMGSGENEAIVTAENRSQTTYFKALTTKENVLAEQDWALEYIPDEDNPDWAIESLNRVISAAINSTGVNYRETLSPYLDIESAIDYYIFSCLIGNYDGEGRNYILGSYNGTKWFFSAYDLDSTFGNEWTGNEYRPPKSTTPTFASFSSLHRVMHLIYTYDKEALKARYAEIRNSVMTESNVLDKFSNFMKDIPKALLDEEVKLWPMIPGTNTNNLSQIMNWYRTRLSYTDSEIAEL